jgi:hypothetical protein
MMATKAEQRFQSCTELITAIDALAPTSGTLAPPAIEPLLTTVNPETQTHRKKGKGWLAVAAVLLIAAVGVGAAMHFDLIPAPWKKGPADTVQSLAALSASADTAVTPTQGATDEAGSPGSEGTSTQESEGTSTPGMEMALAKPETEQFQDGPTQDGAPAMAESPQTRHGAPSQAARPVSPYLHILVKEENEYSEIILASIEEKLIKRGVEVIRGEPDGSGPYVALVVSFRTAGASNLEFYGKSAIQTQAFLTLSLLDLPSRRNLSAPQKKEVLFTELNMNENIEEAVEAALAGFNWQEVRQKRRENP